MNDRRARKRMRRSRSRFVPAALISSLFTLVGYWLVRDNRKGDREVKSRYWWVKDEVDGDREEGEGGEVDGEGNARVDWEWGTIFTSHLHTSWSLLLPSLTNETGVGFSAPPALFALYYSRYTTLTCRSRSRSHFHSLYICMHAYTWRMYHSSGVWVHRHTLQILNNEYEPSTAKRIWVKRWRS